MASTLIEAMGEEIDRISAVYESSFAGQSRATRDLGELDQLIQRTRAVLAQVDQIPAAARGADMSRLRDVAAENLRIYEAEKVAIKEALAAGPDFDEFARLASTANFVFARYFRHYAGKDRATRDLGLLAEMVEDLKLLRQRMTAIASRANASGFKRDVDLVSQSLETYQSELKEIDKAQDAGSPDDQAGVLASVANSQFRVYRVHFANQARVTRRPALLQRVLDNLRRVKTKMEAVQQKGVTVEHNAKNIEIVEQNIKTYEAELGEIRKARQGTQMADIMGMLGDAANQQFEQYRTNFAGKDRATVDLELLGDICDRLGEIARQMTDLGRAEHNDMNERNLGIVIDQLTSFEREFTEVARVKQGAPTQNS